MAKTEKLVQVSETVTDKNAPLSDQLTAKRAELLEARKNLGSTLQNPHTISKIKKDIARILTKINATKGTE